VDPRRLLVLEAVGRCGSIAQAARSMHLSAPAVSQQIAALEREVGLALIDRSGQRARLTTAGAMVFEAAERMRDDLADVERRMARLTGRCDGPVRLAAFQSVMRGLVGPALRDLARIEAGIDPAVVECYGPSAVDALIQGEIDVALYDHDSGDRPPSGPRLKAVELLVDPYRVAVPRSWAPSSSFEDVMKRSWVGGPPGTACDRQLRQLLGRDHDALVVDVCVEFPSMLALVEAGRGAAIIPQLAMGDYDVVVLPDVWLGHRHIGALYSHYRNGPAPVVRALLDRLLAVARRIATEGR
jgi:molybdate transport repressor ModE-like protein